MRFLLHDFLQCFAAASPLANAGNHREVLRLLQAAPVAATQPDDPGSGRREATPFVAASTCPTVAAAR